ncbi:hypothetical protein MNBD_GAMMA23-1855 [hydrothermal vent metagenome]|uniref:Uncharacterized protein n=1 Tax=hydrothermal vent metagenome TaxID=652676 RepID=A0A3B1A626_9ZZZZ
MKRETGALMLIIQAMGNSGTVPATVSELRRIIQSLQYYNAGRRFIWLLNHSRVRRPARSYYLAQRRAVHQKELKLEHFLLKVIPLQIILSHTGEDPVNISINTASKTQSISSRITTSLITLTLGLTIVFGVGFAQGTNDALHNAAHDTRHTMVFPCH